MYISITPTLEQPLSVGDYIITYTIIDNTTGKSFDIGKIEFSKRLVKLRMLQI